MDRTHRAFGIAAPAPIIEEIPARTMTARYAGTCRTCAGRILAGDEILYAGRGLVYHVGECADHHDAGATPAPSSGRRRSSY